MSGKYLIVPDILPGIWKSVILTPVGLENFWASLSLWVGWGGTLIKQKLTKYPPKAFELESKGSLGAQPGLGIQRHYKAPGDLQVTIVRK